jgi:hypothetical protein
MTGAGRGMISKFSYFGLAAALLALPSVTLAAGPAARSHGGAATGQSVQMPAPGSISYNLPPVTRPIVREAKARPARANGHMPRRHLEAEGAKFGDGQMTYIEGPSLSYRTARRGPVLELGALGGGMESAPFLAHLGMDWRF